MVMPAPHCGGSCIINTTVIKNIDWYGKWKLKKLYYIFTFKNSCSDLGAVSLILFWNSDLMKKYNCISSIKDVMQDISTSLYSFGSRKNSNPLRESFKIKYYFNKHLYLNTVSSGTGCELPHSKLLFKIKPCAANLMFPTARVTLTQQQEQRL